MSSRIKPRRPCGPRQLDRKRDTMLMQLWYLGRRLGAKMEKRNTSTHPDGAPGDTRRYQKPVLIRYGEVEPVLTFSPPDPGKSKRPPRGPKG